MSHPNHKKYLPNIKRIEGQLRGIAKMVEEEKYCIEILNQIKAARKALASLEGKILNTHLKACVKDSIKGEKDFDSKVEELINVLKR